jgi:hypothetical protein
MLAEVLPAEKAENGKKRAADPRRAKVASKKARHVE